MKILRKREGDIDDQTDRFFIRASTRRGYAGKFRSYTSQSQEYPKTLQQSGNKKCSEILRDNRKEIYTVAERHLQSPAQLANSNRFANY